MSINNSSDGSSIFESDSFNGVLTQWPDKPLKIQNETKLQNWPEETLNTNLILDKWPESSLGICTTPKKRNEFIRYLASEWFKNQKIDNPIKQATDAINYAQIMYNQLEIRGYFDDE